VINTHPVANHDGDWSEANRFYPLHRAQLAVLDVASGGGGRGSAIMRNAGIRFTARSTGLIADVRIMLSSWEPPIGIELMTYALREHVAACTRSSCTDAGVPRWSRRNGIDIMSSIRRLITRA